MGWPSKNLATPPKNTVNNRNTELRETYNKELSKLNANQTTLAHTRKKKKPTEQQSNPCSKKLHESVNGADRHTDILTHRIQENKIFYKKSSIVNIKRHSFICITISIRAVNVHLSIEQTSNR